MKEKNKEIVIVYDGECPFCTDFVVLSDFTKMGYEVELVSARESKNELVKKLALEYNLDNGMIVVFKGQILYGSEAASFISSAHQGGSIKSALYRAALGGSWRAKYFYPVLVFMRKLYFKVLGRSLINE
jgi:predicted DCC family thiol-disulfide oxidoreductase YuxK